MNILLDFGAIKTGGGVQLALNFLDNVEHSRLRDHELSLVIPDVGPLSERTYRLPFKRIMVSPQSYLARFFFEYFYLQQIMKVERIDTVFTFFGAGLPHPRRVRSVVTVAYPVICYPDSPYWRYIDWEKKARIRILNYLRRRRLKGASKIIAETEIMKSRLIRTLSCAQDKIIVIPPGPSDYVVSRCEDLGGKAFLFPSGNDSHKNLWRLYAVAQRLIERGMDDFVFVLTVDKKAYIKTLRESVINDKIVNERFRFLGTIEPQRIMDLYNMGDYVVSLSDLDSFSNNYMEAWKTGIPLIVSDRDFSRSICGDSAIYVEPHRTDDVADKFIAIVGDVELRSMLVRAGKERLKLLPNQKERFTRVMEEIITS